MRIIVCLALFLAIPMPALAAYSTPFEILGVTRHDNVPREFEAQAHNNDGNTFLSTWINGAQEGEGQWRKVRMNVTTHMKEGSEHIGMKIKVLVYGDMLYYTINDVTLLTEDELTKTTLNSMLKKWVAMPVPSWVDMGSNWNFVDLLSVIDMDLVEISLAWDMVRSSVDSFTMEHTGYQGGEAYSLMHTSPDMNVHIKVNTTKQGSLTYGKYYMNHGSFVFQGSMQPHGTTVNIDVPKHTVSPNEFSMHMLGFEFPMMYGSVPITTDWTPIKYGDPIPEPEQVERQQPRINNLNYTSDPEIPESRNYVEYVKRSGESQESYYQCAWPGTTDAVELERKGICPTKRLYRRDIRRNTEQNPTGKQLREDRLNEQRVIDNFDKVSKKLEDFAHRREFHRAKAILSRSSITEVGSDMVDSWLNNDILPFFASIMRTSVVEHLFIEDATGNEGIALQKMAITETGRRRDFVIILFRNGTGSEPVVGDVYINAKLRDLRAEGLIE